MKIKLYLFIIFFIVLFLSGCTVEYSCGHYSNIGVVFSEDVDFDDDNLKPIGKAEVFPKNKMFFVRIEQQGAFNTDYLHMYAYLIKDDKKQLIYKEKEDIEPECNIFVKKIHLNKEGNYKTVFKDTDGNKLGEGTFEIK